MRSPGARQTVPRSGGSSPAIDFQQARLAGAVPADQADALAGVDAQAGVFEQRQMTEGERNGVERQEHEGLRAAAGTATVSRHERWRRWL